MVSIYNTSLLVERRIDRNSYISPRLAKEWRGWRIATRIQSIMSPEYLWSWKRCMFLLIYLTTVYMELVSVDKMTRVPNRITYSIDKLICQMSYYFYSKMFTKTYFTMFNLWVERSFLEVINSHQTASFGGNTASLFNKRFQVRCLALS